MDKEKMRILWLVFVEFSFDYEFVFLWELIIGEDNVFKFKFYVYKDFKFCKFKKFSFD